MEKKDTKKQPIILTTKDDPRIAAKMEEVSKKIMEKNKNLYRRLARLPNETEKE